MFLVTGLNINVLTQTAQEKTFLTIPQENVLKTVEAVSPYTSALEENQDKISALFGGRESGLIKKPEVTQTIVSTRAYTVEKGDNISTIAQKFNLTVATVLEANNLKSADITALRPGQLLAIPPENTSSSLDWLEEEQKLRQEKVHKQRVEEQKRLASLPSGRSVALRQSSRQTADGGFDGESEGNFIVPIRHNGITRCGKRGHLAVDYRADVGTPVVAAKSGRVTEATGGWGAGFGTSIFISHSGGYGSRYAHLSRIVVAVGDEVSQGEIIGYSGNTGFSTGPHLHFGKYLNGREFNGC